MFQLLFRLLAILLGITLSLSSSPEYESLCTKQMITWIEGPHYLKGSEFLQRTKIERDNFVFKLKRGDVIGHAECIAEYSVHIDQACSAAVYDIPVVQRAKMNDCQVRKFWSSIPKKCLSTFFARLTK